MKKAGFLAALILVAVAGYFIYLSDSSSEQAPVPVITVMDILHASDLEAGIKQAVADGDSEALEKWMNRAQEVAEQAGLSSTDMQYLASSQAVEYVKFNAKRSLFNDEFEERYYALEDIDSLKVKYPEAKDLFPQVEALITKRDQIIEQIAVTLSSGQAPGEKEREAAREMWQSRYAGANNGDREAIRPGTGE